MNDYKLNIQLQLSITFSSLFKKIKMDNNFRDNNKLFNND